MTPLQLHRASEDSQGQLRILVHRCSLGSKEDQTLTDNIEGIQIYILGCKKCLKELKNRHKEESTRTKKTDLTKLKWHPTIMAVKDKFAKER